MFVPEVILTALGVKDTTTGKAECSYDSRAFVHLIQCMGYNDPKKVNKVLEVKPRSLNTLVCVAFPHVVLKFSA